MPPPRLTRLPRSARGDWWVYRATSRRARLLGLALLSDLPDHCALLLPCCSAVHTFGMRFDLDVAFLDRRGRAMRTVHGVPNGRFLRVSGAHSVLEWPSQRGPGPALTADGESLAENPLAAERLA